MPGNQMPGSRLRWIVSTQDSGGTLFAQRCGTNLRSPGSLRGAGVIVRRGGAHERHHLYYRPDRGDHGHPVVPRPALRSTDMSTVDTAAAAGPIPTPGGPLSYIHWGPVIAGAVVAAAVWSVLMAFASAIGLMMVSPSPTWRDTSVWLAMLSGVWIIRVTASALLLGPSLSGRVRSTWRAANDEVEFR